jgi:hypothetical protein
MLFVVYQLYTYKFRVKKIPLSSFGEEMFMFSCCDATQAGGSGKLIGNGCYIDK